MNIDYNVEKEYNNILKSGVVRQDLSSHNALRTALEQVFRESIGTEDYRVEFKEDSIIIERVGNYPDATNGVYHGMKVASRCEIKLESDSNKEFLTVKTENVYISLYPERTENDLSYSATVAAYDKNGIEYGRGDYYTERKVDKYYNPMGMIYSFIGSQSEKPNLDIKFATRNYINSSDVPSVYRWRYNSVTRSDDLIAYRYFVDHIDRSHVNVEESYCTINPYHYERLAGNTQNFAVKTHVSGEISTWKTLDGKSLNSKELSDLISERSVNLDDYLSSRKSR